MHRWTAETADKYELYIQALQSPRTDVEFAEVVYRQQNGSSPVRLQEDFCGTAAVACEWITAGDNRYATGIDINPEPIQWARRHLIPSLTPGQQKRLTLIREDVLRVETAPTDIILALNCSFCVFKERPILIQYLHGCRNALRRGGIVVMEVYAGPESQQTGVDEIAGDGFNCIWEQARFNAITHEAFNRVHFRFPDGSELRDVFVYDWRLWTPVELAEALLAAGFQDAKVYRKESAQLAEGGSGPEECRFAEVPDWWETYIVGFTS